MTYAGDLGEFDRCCRRCGPTLMSMRLEQRKIKVRHRRTAVYWMWRPVFRSSVGAARDKHRQVSVRVAVAVANRAAVNDHHVIQQIAVAVFCFLQALQGSKLNRLTWYVLIFEILSISSGILR